MAPAGRRHSAMKRWVLYALGGVAAMLAVRFGLRLPTLWSLAVGLAVWLALPLIVPARPTAAAQAARRLPADAQEDVRQAQAKVRRLRTLGRRMPSAPLRMRVATITQVAERIVEDLINDPKDLRVARRFLDYYLDATVTVVDRYAELIRKGGSSAEVQPVLAKFDTLLDTIQHTFEKQLDRLLRDDVLDLDTDITVLKQMMEHEGL